MYNYAQDIDLAMFQYYFEENPKPEVIEILEKYQNEDGGFGMLDYDFIFFGSCLKQTESACRYIFALDIPDTHPMISKLMKYIVGNYNKTTGEWDNLTVPEVNNFSHVRLGGSMRNRKNASRQIAPTLSSAITRTSIRHWREWL